ncbi:MAG: response regulator [Planctomycetales bacterium]|nr:response regulator [Planctomycetales bacterium]NIM09579.1 response regulator [Planctomycetales bacterium]NIN09069.1 response regulator [Planctomycetales bacterium]NIN78181.1 response regulator [Planctomycetales bacterium]NIO35365.1 response regulator [Planctomycetales bacterium]
MKTYTSGQVGKICQVAASTVNKWFDTGRLKGYRVPGSRHRRIPRESLIEFLKDHNLPLENLNEVAAANVLLVVRDPAVVAGLQQEFGRRPGYQIAQTGSGFEAGIQAETRAPDCVIVDLDIGPIDVLQICRNLRRRRELANVVIVALVSANRPPSPLDPGLVDEVFTKPFDAALLVQRTNRLLRQRS